MPTHYSYITCKQAISKTKLPGLTYCLNPYFGCEHGCLYCYAPSVFRDEKIAMNWGGFVKARINIVEILQSQVGSISKGKVGISTVTDPYQPLEAKLQLTRRCIEVLSSKGFPVSIQTKSALVLRDKDIIKPDRFDIGVTITTLNEEIAKKIQKKSSPPGALVQVIEEFSSKGIETWIFLGPIIPEINDYRDGILEIIKLAKRTKSTLLYDKLNLKPWVVDSMRSILQKEVPQFEERFPYLLCRKSEYWLTLRNSIENLCSKEGVNCKPAF